MQEQQKLMVDFADYANVLIRMLNNCIKEPHNHLAVYLMQSDGRARLDFIQNMEYKFIELLSVDFLRATDDTIRQHISFRYNSMKSRLQVLQTRLHEVNSIVKTKNPSLLLQVSTAPATKTNFDIYVIYSFVVNVPCCSASEAGHRWRIQEPVSHTLVSFHVCIHALAENASNG